MIRPTKGGELMQHIYIREVNGRIRIAINDVVIDDPHSFSIDYVDGMPMMFSCVTDLEDKEKVDYLS